MKTIISIVFLLVVALVAGQAEARPKRSVYLTQPLVAAAPVVASSYVAASPVVASVPVVQHASVVHSNPTTVTKTEQVHSGDHARYSYSTEVKSQPIVHTHTAVAAAPAALVSAPVATHSAVVSSVAHAVPAALHTVPAYGYGYYPGAYGYYSPYGYVVRK